MTLEQGVLIGQESGVLMALCCRILMIPVLRGVVEGLLYKLNTDALTLHILPVNKITQILFCQI